MAVRYAVATGNWSDTATWNGGTLPTSADDVFANGFTVTIDQDVTVLSIRNTAQSPAVAGGGFILNDGLTVTCTGSGVVTGTTTCLTYSGSGVCTINANIFPANANTTAGVSGLIYSGSGTLNINGRLENIALTITRGPTVLFSGTGTLNINGTITALQVLTTLRITNTSVCNIVGDLNPGNAGRAVEITGNAIVNITGNIFPQEAGSGGASLLLISAAAAVVTVTGNVYPDTTFFQNAYGISVTGSSQLYIIGTINGGSGSIYNTVFSTSNCFISVIGSIKSKRGVPAFYSTGAGAINILTGPFISGDSGVQPLFVTRMHYQRTMGSYFEFRDETTNGALPPAAPAPATRLVSPDTVVDAPIPSDVRDGVSYALNTFTGTLKVPSTASVAFGVPVDNTTGVALLTGDSWIAAISSSNDPFAERLKNVATVQTTAAQIAAF